jgi:hypothetical protein
MTVIDDRGRLFGRVNLIDFALIGLVVVLVPLAYGAYRLLRTPPPRIVAVTPSSLTYKQGEQRVRVTGENLRPFLRATVGRNDAKSFLLERRDSAEVVFDALPTGTYDLALFDFAEELTRLPNAITIVSPPQPPVQIAGRFTGTAAHVAAGARLNTRDRAAVEVLSVAPAVRGERAAVLRAACSGSTGACVVGGTRLQSGASLALDGGEEGGLTFAVDEARIDGTWAEVHVRLFGLAEALALVGVGDVDHPPEPDRSLPENVLQGAVVRSVEAAQSAPGNVAVTFAQNLPDILGFNSAVNASAQLPLHSRAATLRVPVRRVDDAWRYRKEYIRPGSAMTLDSGRYLVRGLIERVIVDDSADRADRTAR